MKDPVQVGAMSDLSFGLDEKGRCCGRKPLKYRRPILEYFCPRCDRAFDQNGIQKENWAWLKYDGMFVKIR